MKKYTILVLSALILSACSPDEAVETKEVKSVKQGLQKESVKTEVSTPVMEESTTPTLEVAPTPEERNAEAQATTETSTPEVTPVAPTPEERGIVPTTVTPEPAPRVTN